MKCSSAKNGLLYSAQKRKVSTALARTNHLPTASVSRSNTGYPPPSATTVQLLLWRSGVSIVHQKLVHRWYARWWTRNIIGCIGQDLRIHQDSNSLNFAAVTAVTLMTMKGKHIPMEISWNIAEGSTDTWIHYSAVIILTRSNCSNRLQVNWTNRGDRILIKPLLDDISQCFSLSVIVQVDWMWICRCTVCSI